MDGRRGEIFTINFNTTQQSTIWIEWSERVTQNRAKDEAAMLSSFFYLYLFWAEHKRRGGEREKESATLCGTTLKGKKQVNTQEEGEQNETLVYIWFHSTSTSSSGYVFLFFDVVLCCKNQNENSRRRRWTSQRRRLGRSPKLIRYFLLVFVFVSVLAITATLWSHMKLRSFVERLFFLFRCSRQFLPDS